MPSVTFVVRYLAKQYAYCIKKFLAFQGLSINQKILSAQPSQSAPPSGIASLVVHVIFSHGNIMQRQMFKSLDFGMTTI